MVDAAADLLNASITDIDAPSFEAFEYRLDRSRSPAPIAGVYCPIDVDERDHWQHDRVLIDVDGQLYP